MIRAVFELVAVAGIRTRIRHKLFPLLIVGVVAGGGVACGDSIVDPTPLPPQQLFFVSGPFTPSSNVQQAWFDLKKDIYRVDGDGTGAANLTKMSSYVYAGMSLSPDGRRLAFSSDRESCFGIWTMNLDGTDLKNLTGGNFFDVRCNRLPRWSRDGSRIAFSTTREGRFSVYVMNADGSNPRNVSSPLDAAPESTTWPRGWTPDGKVILQHMSTITGAESIRAYTVNPDGTALAPFGEARDHSPAWSPDGSKVAFIREANGSASLYVSNSNGSNARRLTDHAGHDRLVYSIAQDNDHSPWSPDGSHIAFANTLNNKHAIDVIRVDGTGHRRLTGHGTVTAFNGWSNDGQITFTSDSAGTMDIYVIKPDGSGLKNLTSSATHDGFALWVPRP